MRSNPFFHMIEVVRAPILGEPLETSSLVYLAVMLVLGWALAAFAYRRYARFVPIWI
jgi:ABC-2 type transport system permease protein/lipopolysaccharide transport system permease protein